MISILTARPVIYLASLDGVSDDLTHDRMRQVRAIDRLIDLGYAPVASVFYALIDEFDPRPPSVDREIRLLMLLRASAVLRLPGNCELADLEVATAHEAGVPVFTSFEELWLRMQPVPGAKVYLSTK